MKHYRAILPILAVSTVLVACRREPPPAPAPSGGGQQQTQTQTGGTGTGGTDAAAQAAAETAAALAILREMIHFDFDSYDIRPDAQTVLSRKVPILRANPQVRLRIEGHADERGSLEYNQALGLRRANAARDFLVGFGIDASRLETVSFGEERPLDPRSTEEAWAQNRRAEFQVTAGAERLTNPVSQ